MSATPVPPFSTNTILASTFVSVGSVVFSLPFSSTKYAVLLIFPVKSLLLSTVTLNVNVTESSAGTLTCIPCAKSSAVLVVVSSFICILPSVNVVPVGMLSFIVANPSTFPSFSTVIVYVIVSPSDTSSGFALFSILNIGL